MITMTSALGWQEFWLPTMLFALATSASPGPVNIAAASSGIAFGLVRTLPQVLGATIGFSSLLVAMGLGMHALVASVPVIQSVLKGAGSVFLAYLAWKLWHASDTPSEIVTSKPPGMLEGAIAQWVNPKAWIVAASGIATYTYPGEAYGTSVIAMSIVFLVICFPSVGAWALFGAATRKLLRTERAVRRLNMAMSMLLLVSISTLFL
ncbi:LysE family translocator [Aromatoleum toluclasticum]|uniref:LysE family translocator n=1 Tax=Aromatoleum toluclasticum TaxID=92003 RepID=UPI000382DE97|nr:LysE family translocator [Aromatoleum toluclasticum]